MVEQIVTSRYFQKSGMDESFTDFKEKKNIFTEPKSKKPKGKKQITKKRIKGQKDIRTLIRSKKNELLTFTKDFNDVCAQGGVDIDSQELQLAIALSKSLQHSDQTATEEFPTNNLTTQERTNRIRRTLQEYGFRVPQVKIKLEGCKRVKKYRKSYKLLQITEAERLQKICNKYSQVLFENPDKSFEKDTNDFNTGSKLYHLATNTTYEDIKTNIVYATEIFQEISFTKGNLLRNWSDIPGRPESPKLIEEYVISMPDLQCSQYELDIILSGTVNKAKDILKSKLNLDTNVELNNISVETKLKTKDFELKGGQEVLAMLHEDRSNSPDIFDDDHSIVYSVSDYDKKKIKTGDSNISMLDLIPPTQAINKNPCSQSSNTTKRRTNDFMDLTECILTTQCKTKLLETEELTNNSMELTKCVNPISQESKISKDEIKSLSPECVLLDEPAVVSEQKVDNSLDETIIVKDYVDLRQYCPKQLEDSLKIDNMETMDLTQSSNSNDELPAVNIPGTQRFSPDDTIIVQHNSDIPQTNIKPSNSKEPNVIEVNDIVLDISNEIPEFSFNAQNRSTILHNSQNRIEDFAENKSFSLTATRSNKENDDIDLTQSSDSTIDGYYENFTSNVSKNEINYNSLGKKGDISIDYDFAFDQVEENAYQIDDQSKDSESKSTNNSHIVASDISDNFKLCDRELNYSMHKSRVDDYGDISIVDRDDIPVMAESRSCFNNYTINRSLSESDLPIVNINEGTKYRDKQFNITLSKSACSTPIKATVTDDKVSISTPSNSEYIVKLGQVTPMLDYEAMSSPERNKELEKYGLKPFKRKRAIQLLTHLYNQTHPVIEKCSEDSVPLKKFKPNSPERVISEENVILNKENIYNETKTNPDIRNIECCPDDWVFQKREKAKDLLKFLDRKCITVKTADNARNNK
ncbi:PREDICTED: structure-specific endonuclease subunit SLX4 isoform X2 [Papilio polytes]|uniref:structure-specific endonuclease subunit SLX4 isoform X2 n=1 Tax=Papilio polytes TaxID=76194 RepID=UPI0006765F48|nr:PREDICTED: structure-specific endonuclease subunit SLX4 isoform X2 [Papilio polytes]